jgi:hypothetical protein
VLLKKKGLEGMEQEEEATNTETFVTSKSNKNIEVPNTSSESRNIAIKFLKNIMHSGGGQLDEKNFLKTFFPNLFKAKTLGTGESFGEVALKETMPR